MTIAGTKPPLKQIDFKALVLAKEPRAWEHDDGQWIYIHVAEDRQCRCICGHVHTNHAVQSTASPSIGGGGSSEYAWQSAAYHLGLVKSGVPR